MHLLARAVEQRPGAEALVCGQRRERYEDLWQRVARLAGLLSARGVAPGDRVALVLQNSPEYVAAYYAVLSLGGLVTPLSAEARIPTRKRPISPSFRWLHSKHPGRPRQAKKATVRAL